MNRCEIPLSDCAVVRKSELPVDFDSDSRMRVFYLSSLSSGLSGALGSVLLETANGFGPKDIGAKRTTSWYTVFAQRRRLYGLLGVHAANEAMAKGLELGILGIKGFKPDCLEGSQPFGVKLFVNYDSDILTRAEGMVLGLVAQGYAHKEIQVKLRIATATVRSHVRNILDKLICPRGGGLRSKGAAVCVGIATGLLCPDKIPT